jgi:hypothetical protein
MSETIETNFVRQFGTMVYLLAEQRGSRLRSSVASKSVQGEAWTMERLASVDYQEITERFAPMPRNEIDHSRRWGFVRGYDTNVLLDNFDKVKTLVSFESPYTQRLATTMGRAIDRTIITALDGDVREGKNAEANVVFPTAQRVFSLNTSNNPVPLGFRALLAAKEKLLASYAIDLPGTPVNVAMNANAWRSLLEDDKLTSADFNSLRAIENAGFSDGSFMGLRFFITELLPDVSDAGYDSGAAANRVFVYRQDALEFGVAQEPSTFIDPRPDLRTRPWQAYCMGAWGASRIEDVRVVRIHAKKIA